MPTLDITPTRMVVADKFDSENDHLRLASGVDRVRVTEDVTSGLGVSSDQYVTYSVFVWKIDGVASLWDASLSRVSLSTPGLNASTYEVGI